MLKKSVLMLLMFFLFAPVATAGFAWQEHVDKEKYQLVGYVNPVVGFFDTTTIKLKRDNEGLPMPHMVDVWMIHYFFDEDAVYKREEFYSGYILEDVQSKYFLIHKIYDLSNGTEAILKIEEYDEYGLIFEKEFSEVYIPIMPESIGKCGIDEVRKYLQENYSTVVKREDPVIVEPLELDKPEEEIDIGWVW